MMMIDDESGWNYDGNDKDDDDGNDDNDNYDE